MQFHHIMLSLDYKKVILSKSFSLRKEINVWVKSSDYQSLLLKVIHRNSIQTGKKPPTERVT